MSEIKYRNIPMFIGKTLLMPLVSMILSVYFDEDFLFVINFLFAIDYLGYIVFIIFFVCFIFNLFALVILYSEKTIYILKWFDTIFLIIFIIVFVLVLIFVDEGELNSHGVLIIIPLVLNIVYFLIAFVIDILIIKNKIISNGIRWYFA
jgi:hypothetical protein